MSYGPHTHNPIEQDESPMDDELTFACSCGDDSCRGHYGDKDNIRIGKAFYAADCPMGNQLDQIVSGRVAAALSDERRDR